MENTTNNEKNLILIQKAVSCSQLRTVEKLIAQHLTLDTIFIKIDILSTKTDAFDFSIKQLSKHMTKGYKSMDLTQRELETLQKEFMDLRRIMIDQNGDFLWNKGCFTIGLEDFSIFEYKLDADMEWLINRGPNNKAYKNIDQQTLVDIMSWEGLPEDHPRPWLN